MNIPIASPNGPDRVIELTPELEAHFNEPIQHANTILRQINGGMYKQWFEGKKDLVVIDFGANIGLVSLYMLPACAKIISVEPTPSHFKLLTEMKSINGNPDNWWLENSALSDKNGKVVFATGHATENKITSNEGWGNGKINVQCHMLNSYLQQSGLVVDFCKIDIESGEMIALNQPELNMSYGMVRTFFVEIHPGHNGGMNENREELIKRFKFAGYKIEVIDFQTIIAYE